MMKKHLLISILPLALSACSGGTAECNDGDIKDTVKNIIESNILKAVWAQDIYKQGLVTDVEVSAIKTTSYDEKLDFYTCAATFSFNYKDEPQAQAITYELSFLEDKGETEVGVYGVQDIKGKMMGLTMMRR